MGNNVLLMEEMLPTSKFHCMNKLKNTYVFVQKYIKYFIGSQIWIDIGNKTASYHHVISHCQFFVHIDYIETIPL